jgi:hypothetical protein
MIKPLEGSIGLGAQRRGRIFGPGIDPRYDIVLFKKFYAAKWTLVTPVTKGVADGFISSHCIAGIHLRRYLAFGHICHSPHFLDKP